MTRMWGVNPVVLCQEHLLGEHSELHQEVGTIRNHPHGLAIVEGHAEQAQVDTSKLQDRHDELASEMERRGMDHDSPLAYEDELNLGRIDVEANLEELTERCETCHDRFHEKMYHSYDKY